MTPPRTSDALGTLLLWVYRLCVIGFVTFGVFAVYRLATTGMSLVGGAVAVWYVCALYFSRDHLRKAFGR